MESMDSSSNLWPAPYLPPQKMQQLRATITVGGSKSITNRAFVLAALSSTPSTIYGALRSRDTDLMLQALRAMGTGVDAEDPAHGTPNQTVRITPHRLHGGSINCGLAGTVMRFVPPIAATAAGSVFFDGDPHARKRPMGPILQALRQLGVSVSGDRLPFTINPDQRQNLDDGATELADDFTAHDGDAAFRNIGGEVVVDASASSQFISGLLLAAPRYGKGLTLRTKSATPSQPHIDMTLAMLAEAGVDVAVEADADSGLPVYRIAPTTFEGRDWHVEPDLSNATPFLAAAAVTGGQVTIRNWPQHTTQAGDQFRTTLGKFGAQVRRVGGDLEVTGPDGGQLNALDLDMSEIGELLPTVAAMAVFARGTTRLRGVAHLRGHETDRLAAMTTELKRIGVHAVELHDGIEINPVVPERLHGAQWHSYDDHRMATAGAIVGLRVPGVEVENIGTTAKTMPNFDLLWSDMLSDVSKAGGNDTAADEARGE